MPTSTSNAGGSYTNVYYGYTRPYWETSTTSNVVFNYYGSVPNVAKKPKQKPKPEPEPCTDEELEAFLFGGEKS